MTVAVVVPTCNRAGFLRDVIGALQAQTHCDFEAVVVDDGSVDDSVIVALSLIEGDERFRIVSTPNRGPAAARNTGWRSTSTDWIAFTDDDCLPQPRWVESLLDCADLAQADLVQGVTVPDPSVDRGDLPWFSRSQRIAQWSGRFQTCNLLVRRSCLEDVSGFDESFPPHGFGEDTDLGLRLVRNGATTAFAPAAVVHHRVLPMTFFESVRRRYRWAQVVHLVAVNPDARTVFPHRYLAYRMHAAFWAAFPVAIWAILTGRWCVLSFGVAGFGVLQASTTRHKGRPAIVRWLWGITDLVGLAAAAFGFVVESARQRRLLL